MGPVVRPHHKSAIRTSDHARTRQLRSGTTTHLDLDAASEYGEIAARKMRSGKKVEALDLEIAAIARRHGASVATRNTKHFEDCGLELINPWDAA